MVMVRSTGLGAENLELITIAGSTKELYVGARKTNDRSSWTCLIPSWVDSFSTTLLPVAHLILNYLGGRAKRRKRLRLSENLNIKVFDFNG